MRARGSTPPEGQPRLKRCPSVWRTGQGLEPALAALPERQREALWLRAVEGLSYAEVASALETTESSVKALIHRARVALVREVEGGGAR